MKINYKNTALNLLDKWDEEINIPEAHKYMSEEDKKAFGRSILEMLEEKGKGWFGQKIQYVSQPFIDAYMKGRHKLVDVFDKEEMDESGTFIWQGSGFTFTNFYYVKTYIKDGEWSADYFFIQFSKAARNDHKSIDICISGFGDTEKTFLWKGHSDSGHNHSYYFAFIVTFLCFIKHVEVEKKVIQPQKRDYHIGTKYVNETKSKIEILDSTWFTTLVRSDAFKVRGHFRLQPCGKDMTDRKLIWISDFEKSGYTRKAKILTDANNFTNQ